MVSEKRRTRVVATVVATLIVSIATPAPPAVAEHSGEEAERAAELSQQGLPSPKGVTSVAPLIGMARCHLVLGEAELALRKTEVQQMDESLKAASSEVANVAAQLEILSSQRAAASATVDAAVANLVVAQDKIKVAEANVERARAEAEIQ